MLEIDINSATTSVSVGTSSASVSASGSADHQTLRQRNPPSLPGSTLSASSSHSTINEENRQSESELERLNSIDDYEDLSIGTILGNNDHILINKSTVEETLLNKLDIFLANLEKRLDTFEQFFFSTTEDKKVTSSTSSNNNNNPSTSYSVSVPSLTFNPATAVYNYASSLVGSDNAKKFQSTYEILISIQQKCKVLVSSSSSNTSNNKNHSSSSVLERGKITAEILISILELNYGNIKTTSSNLEYELSNKLSTALKLIDEKTTSLENLLSHNHHYELNLNQSGLPINEHLQGIKSLEINIINALKLNEKRLLQYHELPIPWRENKFILRGYRFQNKSLNCFKSIFNLHNESINIWTHLFGIFWIFYICFLKFPKIEKNLFFKINWEFQKNDKFIIFYFLFAAFICLSCSVLWHTFSNISNYKLRGQCACVDYTGITFLITASIITTEWTSLYYYPFERNCYTIFSSFCGMLGLFFNWSSYFDKPENRHFRILFFISLAVSGIAAFGSAVNHYGLSKSFWFYFPLWKSFACYLIGVFFYGFLIPECFRNDYDEIYINNFNPKHNHHHHIHHELINEVEINKNDQNEESINNQEQDSISSIFIHKSQNSIWKSFKYLSWVDFILSSHNIWHVFVLGGIIGHWSALMNMFENIPNLLTSITN